MADVMPDCCATSVLLRLERQTDDSRECEGMEGLEVVSVRLPDHDA